MGWTSWVLSQPGSSDSYDLEPEGWKAGKHVALYFSTADVSRNADRDPLKALEDYQRERQKDTSYATLCTGEELQQLAVQRLPKIVSEAESVRR
jgi:hypothetical protein